MSKKPVTRTIAPDLAYRRERDLIKLAYANREFWSNAGNYAASDVYQVAVHHQGEDYLIWAHTGTPPEDLQEILQKAVTPYASDRTGAAINGCGAIATAHALDPDPELIFAAYTTKDGFVAGRYFTIRDAWQWDNADATDKAKFLLSRYAKGLYKKCKVFSIVKYKPNMTDINESRTMLGPRLFTLTACLAPAMLSNQDFKVHYCEKQIGYPYKKTNHRTKYATHDTAISTSEGGSGSRLAVPWTSYTQGYMAENGSFTIPCDPFEWRLKDRRVKYSVTGAKVHVLVFPGRRSKPDRERTTWLITERAFDDHKAGTQDSCGCEPYVKAFLTMPWVYDQMVATTTPAIASQYIRFKDNVLGMYTRPAQLMGFLDLPYCDGQPFVVIQVEIDKIDTLYDEERNTQEAASPPAVLNYCGRRSDFTFGTVGYIHDLMKAACEAAKAHVPQALREMCEKYFPPPEGDWYEFDADDDGSRIGKKFSNSKYITTYDLDNGGVVFGGDLALGEAKRLAFYHTQLGEWLGDMKKHPATRGVTFDKLNTKELNSHPAAKKAVAKLRNGNKELEIPVFNITISEMGDMVDGELVPCKVVDYQFGSSVPSRNIVLHYDEERVTFICGEVPKRIHTGGGGQGKKHERDPNSRGGVSKRRVSCVDPRDGKAWFTYEEASGILKYNTRQSFPQHYFKKRAKATPKLSRLTEELYSAIKATAANLKSQLEDCGFELTMDDPPDGYIDRYDWLLNELLKRELRTNPLLTKQIEKLDAEIGEEDQFDWSKAA